MSNVASKELSRELWELSSWPHDVAYGYSLGYLLRKLHSPSLQLETTPSGRWVCRSIQYLNQQVADTPEDAAVKLAILLFKQGVLPTKDKAA
jgi:hypothetical protein